ncbi:MAG TPA: virulence factor [Vicinamibacterales bacterium]|nr:virulence factor [Vicinamibacterales bacterium]
MATYRVLYWQEVPSQIRAEDGHGDVSVALSPKFMARIDALAAARGLEGSDDYLAQWRWSDEAEREGSAEEVAEAVRRELEAQADW